MADPATAPSEAAVAPPRFATRDAKRLGPADAPAFAAFALRTRSRGAREVLASAATDGMLDHDALLESARRPASAGPDRDGASLPALHPVWGPWLAYVEALTPDADPDLALALLDRVAADEPGALPARVADVRAQCLLRAGRRQATRDALDQTPVTDDIRWEIECDLANPHLWPDGGPDEWPDERAWLDLLSRPFVRGGVEPVGVGGQGDSPFARLRATVPSVDPGVLKEAGMVSVVMSSFRPDRDIIGACRSILDQTWSNLELLVIDDASPAGSEALLAEVAALDPRVRVLRAPTNGGTYQVRNLALREARGDFMTFQDSDDWSHPRRLEVQVRALLGDPSLLATRTPAIRAYPDLSLTWPGYPAQRPNASSLLFRLREVHELIGDFDAVRKSADMEYPRRLQALRPKSVKDVDEHGPMAITQLRGGSLSRTDAVPGWIRWTRLSYHDAYVEWHERIRTGAVEARLDSEGPRAFPMPDPTWSPWRTSTEIPREHFDLVVLGDWRSGRRPRRQLLDELTLLAASGLRVGIAHAEAPFPLPAKREPRSRPVQRLVNAGVVELTHLERASEVGLLLVVDPDALTYLPDTSIGLVPRRAMVVVDDDDPASEDADRAVREAFGVTPLWTARHRGLLDDLRREAPALSVDDEVLPYAVDVAALRVTGRRMLGPTPVLGHHLPDEASRWPADRTQLLAAYPPESDVRLLHGTSAARRVLRTAAHPVGWLSFDGTPLPTRTFLSRLDFFVYLGVRDHVADHALLEAMAAGCIPVVSEEFADVAGDGAVYVPKGDGRAAGAAVSRLAAEPEAFRQLQTLSGTRVRNSSYVSRIRDLARAEAPTPDATAT